MRSLVLAAVVSCVLTACDTATLPEPALTAATAEEFYEFGADVEVSISNRTEGTASLLFFCGSVLEKRTAGGWAVVSVPDCSRVFEAETEIEAGSEHVGVLVLPSDETLEVGAVYRFRFTGVEGLDAESDALATNSFEIVPTF